MAGYVRTDTSNNIADGNIINASDLDGEFDGIQAAFNASTGHNHDGTTGEGAPILVTGPTQDVVFGATTITPKTTNTVDIGSSSLKFKDIFITGTANLPTVTATTVNATTVDTTNVEVTNIKAKDGTASATIADSTGVMTISSAVLTTADINGGTLDNVVIGGSTAAAGTFTTVTATTVNATTVDTTNIEVTTLKAKDGTSAGSIADSTGVVTLASSVLTTADINGGTLDNVVIGGATAAAATVTTLTTSSTVTINGGTANGVAYLNGSKVLTTGSALTFDGTNFCLGTASSSGGYRFTQLVPASGTAVSAFRVTNGSDATFDVNLQTSLASIGTGVGDLAFLRQGSEQMRLTSTGLGIGTSSPLQKLSVAGNANFIGTGVTSLTSPTVYFSNTTSSTGRTYGLNSTDGGLFQIFDASAGNATRVALDSSGNLGLGVTPSAWSGSGVRAFDIGAAAALAGSGTDVGLIANAYYNGSNWIYKISSLAARYQILVGSGSHAWFTAPSGTAGNAISFTQAMTLDSSGNLLVGTTSAAYASGERISVSPAASSNAIGIAIGNTNNVGIGVYNGYTATGTATALQFQDHNSVVRGSITVTTSATAYNTSSDYRLKEDIQPMTGALAKVAALKPCTYKWKADGSDGEGFIAHELQAVVPQCVTGEKDAVDEEGKPVYQGIDTSFLVATLTAAIQEQQAIIDAQQAALTALTARVAALESNP